MRRRLRSFPSDLEDYFGTILERVDDFYKRRSGSTAMFLRLAMLCYEWHFIQVPQFLLWWLIEDGADSPDYAGKLEQRTVSAVQIAEMAKKTQTLIRAYCKDLLFVSSTNVGCWTAQVLFLHRTVYDYLQYDARLTALPKEAIASFGDIEFMVRLRLAWLKIVPSEGNCLSKYHPIMHQTITDMTSTGLVDELGLELALTVLHHTRYATFGAECFGSTDYQPIIMWLAQTYPDLLRGSKYHPEPLLYSVLGLMLGPATGLHRTDLTCVMILLEAGADANQVPEGQDSTIWHLFLKKWYAQACGSQKATQTAGGLRWVQQSRGAVANVIWSLASKLMEHGADVSTALVTVKDDGDEETWEVMQLIMYCRTGDDLRTPLNSERAVDAAPENDFWTVKEDLLDNDYSDDDDGTWD